ncbi:replication protein [Paenibacillus sp. 19GGS1-52]|uniref:replication protein n=1 Tax=Paenibacillus sp. 19GGS1-52 TaxID=2758563 RepID=UPI001EFB7C4C|nr:replication protein [Paenibacillus sp. 19GGS1-52]ULO07167.1 replication protein [Paenibacillus sp. 19GGS1-52]
MDSSVNPQPTDAHIRISHEIHRELIRRKFSQRQRDVIDFILTLSWGCGKPSAIIPELKNFEESGIRKNHIREVLDGLVTGNIILWDKVMNIFQLNKHYDQWTIETVSSSTKKFNELINLNLARPSPNLLKLSNPKKGTEFPKEEPSSQIGDQVPEKGTEFPKEEPSSSKGYQVPEKGIGFPKKEQSSSQKGNRAVPKRGTVRRDYPSRINGFSVSKASIKARFKRTTTTRTTSTSEPAAVLKNEYSFEIVSTDYKNNFLAGGRVNSFDVTDLQTLFDTYGGEWLHSAMRTAYRLGPDKRNLGYVSGILKGYRERGGMDTNQPKKESESSVPPAKPKKYGDSRNESGRRGKPQIEIYTQPLQPPTAAEIAMQEEMIAEYLARAEADEKRKQENQGQMERLYAGEIK